VRLLTSAEDPGYSAATNRGVDAGEGEVIVLLNNDAFCRPDFVERLIAPFQDDARIGAVAPLTLREDEQTIDSVGVTLDVTLAPFVRLSGLPRTDAGRVRPLLVSPGGGADAYRRSAWTEVGGFDERLAFYGADIDLALRLHSIGWKAVAATDAVAVHLRSATSGARSSRARSSGGWARAFLLRRWGVLRTRVALRVLVTEGIVVAADLVLSRDLVALRSRIAGWRAARASPRREIPSSAVDPGIGFVESLRRRWSSR